MDPLSRPSALLTVGEVQRSLYPLRAAADRVGKQVEEFAETLDRLSARNHQKPKRDCRDVLPLVLSYKKIAHDTVEQLKKTHTHEKHHQPSRTKRRLRSSNGSSTPLSTYVQDDFDSSFQTKLEDLKIWEQEEQTWDLLGLLLQVDYPIPQPNTQRPEFDQGLLRPCKGSNLHRYSSEKEVWDRFLGDDDLAWERHTVVEWLKRCANSSGQDIELVVKELEADADRGSGLESHSWLYTKEAIKGQKRLRAFPQVLDPQTPGIDEMLLNADQTNSLITQLDPDAITRQGRGLEKQDHYFERAIWLACWEMIRRGKSWDSVREWCQERVEGWRAIAMRGDPRVSSPKDNTHTYDKTLAANWLSRALWRKTCALAAKRGGIDKYECAVYGVLSGYLPSVKTVCESWDDYLFAHYNSYLLRQFDRYVKTNFPDRLPKSLVEKYGCFKISVAAGRAAEPADQIIKRMKILVRTNKEARQPFKNLQGSLIAKDFDEFLYKQGNQLARSANTSDKKKVLPYVIAHEPEDTVNVSITMDDHDLLRIVTHTIFIFQDLGLGADDVNRQIATENFVVAYMDYLRQAGKQQLLPIYAARLSPGRANNCLGRQLAFIQESKERQTLIRLMERSGIDVLGVLNRQLLLIIKDSEPDHATSTTYPRLHILEPTKEEKSFIHPVRKGFIGNSITGEQQGLISAFEWYLLLEDHWQQTLTIGTVLYKHLLRKYSLIDVDFAGTNNICVGMESLAAARELSKAVTFSSISKCKTKRILGREQDISQTLDNSDDEGESNSGIRITRSHHSRSQRQIRNSTVCRTHEERLLLLEQSKTFRDFEALFAVLDAMEKWKEIADEASRYAINKHFRYRFANYRKSYSDSRKDARGWKVALQKSHENLETLIDPLLHGWLQCPRDGIPPASIPL